MTDQRKTYSPFITAVVGKDKAAPDVQVLTGWFGPGEEGCERLYLDPELSTFVDIPKDAILYSEEIPDSHPGGARTVWIRRNADLKEGGSALARAAKFLTGQVQQEFARGAVPPTTICLTFNAACEAQGQQFGDPVPRRLGGGGPPITLPPPGPTNACVTMTGTGPLCCPITAIGCPDPNPSTVKACATAVPALCPNPGGTAAVRMGQVPVSGPGWTCFCPPQHTMYPQCTSQMGVCATRPPCF